LPLLKERWDVEWADEMGKTRNWCTRKPGLFVWKKLREKRQGQVIKALKGLFKPS
jgi:hypothetical protein